jgi:hypothetical protein
MTATTTTTKAIKPTRQPAAKPAAKPVLDVKWVEAERPDGRIARINLQYQSGREDCGYYSINPLGSDQEVSAFEVREVVVGAIADGYHVLIGHTNPQDGSCTCLGFGYHRHCKHVDALKVLMCETDEPRAETRPTTTEETPF